MEELTEFQKLAESLGLKATDKKAGVSDWLKCSFYLHEESGATVTDYHEGENIFRDMGFVVVSKKNGGHTMHAKVAGEILKESPEFLNCIISHIERELSQTINS